MDIHVMRRATGGACVAAFLLGLALPALADVSIQVDGNPVNLSPGPIERDGRVFVPLRGVFEQLGASVVYQNGTIDATARNGHAVSLQIGSNQAVVNGQTQTMDVAPFIVGASTYVPLRFVSQALGASVNYDASNQIVAITRHGGGEAYAPQPAAQTQSSVQLQDVRPGRDATVTAERPTIRAEFSQPVDPNSLRVTLDDRDVTDETTLSPTGIVYAPESPLQSTEHRIRITGTDRQGAPFSRSWSFTTGTQTSANFLDLRAPGQGTVVGTTFTVRGKTLPGAQVHIIAGSTINAGSFSVRTGSYQTDVRADSSGHFSDMINLNGVSGGTIGLTVISTDPSSDATAAQHLRLQVG
ncbi:MAG TPA: copper amine oxidase N-terminal domain-containing protein [Candidatus Acidoferrales bacterium]|nr:copper amine oxidase N-terminal domain-containing protein [Candidatus Acidoferrales bacterium]